jgi:hypothetical protein
MRTRRYLSRDRQHGSKRLPSTTTTRRGPSLSLRRCAAASPPDSPKIPSRNLTSSRQSLCGPCCLSGKKNDLRE